MLATRRNEILASCVVLLSCWLLGSVLRENVRNVRVRNVVVAPPAIPAVPPTVPAVPPAGYAPLPDQPLSIPSGPEPHMCKIPACRIPRGDAASLVEAGDDLIAVDPEKAACLSMKAVRRARREKNGNVAGAAFYTLGRALERLECTSQAYLAYRSALCNRPGWSRSGEVISACVNTEKGSCTSDCQPPQWEKRHTDKLIIVDRSKSRRKRARSGGSPSKREGTPQTPASRDTKLPDQPRAPTAPVRNTKL